MTAQEPAHREAIEAILSKTIGHPDIERWLRDVLLSCPTAGSGVHRWLFRAACELHPFFTDKEELGKCLTIAMSGCGREPHFSEVEDAVNNSQRILLGENSQHLGGTVSECREKAPKWPPRDETKIAEIASGGPDLAELKRRSPMAVAPGSPDAETIVGQLFPAGSLICAGRTQQKFSTAPIEKLAKFRLFRQMQFAVPSPMSARYGCTVDGRQSQHTKDNTGPRRFLVCEFDNGTADEQAALIWHLAQQLPLVLVVHSGGKSLHSWFFVAGRNEADLLKFMQYAVSLGADQATWLKSQFVRIPGGRRENGKLQTVLFWNPKNLEN